MQAIKRKQLQSLQTLQRKDWPNKETNSTVRNDYVKFRSIQGYVHQV